MSGKGSKPRPFSVSQDEYDKRWDAIFGRDLPKEPELIVEGQLPSEEDIIESEDADLVCPECRSDLIPTLMSSQYDDTLGISNHRYRYQCFECGYVSAPWDVLCD